MQMKQTVVIHAKPLSTYLFLLLCGLFGINSSFTATVIIVPLINDTDQLALVSFKGEIHGDPFEVLEPWNNSFHFCRWKGISCGRRHQRVTILNLEGTFLFRLRDLLLGNNFFESRIPASLSNCSDLRHIRMFKNHFSGAIPAEISSLSKLLVLDLSSNQFSGVIPPSLGNLTTLTNLSLQYKKIGGSIPVELRSLANLQYLNLATNNLSGAVPYTLYNLSSMITFFLANNLLSDQLPLDFGLNFPNLEQINIDSNQFFGPIPSTIVNASRLTNIDFSTNYFSGRVPLNIGTLYELEYLQISYNRLGSENGTGDLGFIMSLTNCTKLKLLLVVGNGFRDEFPSLVANFS
ncbi:hypothetical protein K2173_002797 [Erythroxylum novogranatense]|uniref:Leucine-rich repeat-containing N-terminal plant-type domain-containing protein n=1 Tax=Erythroxylum novogranatense TaxID=1862640 RepID=A0AAV8SPZ7_9ROSI|nr:hypothetical protein K2173_002797 [Erythroxylum novogranatense]